MATVLLVDDRAAHREQVSTLLGGRGHRVIEAEGAADALAAARGEHPDVVVTDPLLPDLDGYTLVRELRADPGTAATPVVFATAGYLEHEIRPMAEACGVARVVLDTPDPEPLLAAIDAVLAQAPGAAARAVPEEMALAQVRAVNTKLVQRVRELETKAGADVGADTSVREGGRRAGGSRAADTMIAAAVGDALEDVARRRGPLPDSGAAPEAWLRAAERLDSVGRLAGEVGHDVNNALSVILAYVRSVADTVTDEVEGGRLAEDLGRLMLDDLDRVLRAGDRAAHLTRRLVTFGRRDGARPSALDLGGLLESLESTLARTLGERVDLVIRAEGGLRPVFADPGQLSQLLMDLALDTHDALPTGGSAVFTVTDHQVTEPPPEAPGLAPGEYVQLTVDRESANGDAAPRVPGRGIASVRATVQHAGGDIAFLTGPAASQSVHVFLPVAGELAAGGKPDAPAPRGGSETVLLVDDEETLRTPISRTLRRAGYHVLTAADGMQALTEAERYRLPIHLLLTDVVMPGMLGRELAERLVPLRPGLRVIYMSGYAPAIMSVPGLYSLSKPFSDTALLGTVRAILDANG
jgi:CheY-like chemotaxis protein